MIAIAARLVVRIIDSFRKDAMKFHYQRFRDRRCCVTLNVLAHVSHQGLGVPDLLLFPLPPQAEGTITRRGLHNQANFFLGQFRAFNAGGAADGPEYVEPV
jgi:hypothetical protein